MNVSSNHPLPPTPHSPMQLSQQQQTTTSTKQLPRYVVKSHLYSLRKLLFAIFHILD